MNSTASSGGPTPPGHGGPRRRATMRDVAVAAGVSVMTVSRVVNGQQTVDPELARRVEDAASKLAFEPNGVARDLRNGAATSTIGLVIEDLANPFYARLAREVEEFARGRDTLLITSSSEENAEREREIALELFRRRVSGLLIVPAPGDHSYLATQAPLGVPIVLIDRPTDGIKADTVVIDNYRGAKSGTERLIAAGHRRIAVLGFTLETFTVAERVRGFRAALDEAGIPFDASLLRLGALKEDQASSEVAALLGSADPPTAFLCLNNRMTVGVVSELDRRNERRDVVGFDEVAFANFLPQPVTFVTYDIQQLARWAVEMLFRRIDGDTSEPKLRTVRTSLVTLGRHAT